MLLGPQTMHTQSKGNNKLEGSDPGLIKVLTNDNYSPDNNKLEIS